MLALDLDRPVNHASTAAAAGLQCPREGLKLGRREPKTRDDRDALAATPLSLAPDPDGACRHHRTRSGLSAAASVDRAAATGTDATDAGGVHDTRIAGRGFGGRHGGSLPGRGHGLDGTEAATENAAMENVLITPARRNDTARLAAMSRRLVEAGLEPSWTEARIERQRLHHDSVVLVARLGGGVAGFAIMQYGDDAAHLNLLAVEPVHQRHGIGRQLVVWLEDTARIAGTFRIRLEVRSSNRGARNFYSALGYRQNGEVRGYYQNVEDAIRFERDLSTRPPAAPAD